MDFLCHFLAFPFRFSAHLSPLFAHWVHLSMSLSERTDGSYISSLVESVSDQGESTGLSPCGSVTV
jgi:hypothetical protein